MIKKIPTELYLVLAALLMLGGMLGAHGIWTQEYRWQQVCMHMIATKDYWHPYLDGKPYYDKPLLSYWLIIALAKLNHGVVSNTVLRIPSVCAGFISLGCTYWLGKFYADRRAAQLSVWLLLTTFYFVFWARVASADMWNVAAILLAIVWYLKIEASRIFWRDFLFFLILVVGALLKGLIAPALVFIVLLPHLRFSWKSFFNIRSMIAAVFALGIYLAPFMISSMTAGNHYGENGLVEVFRENILRFFQPFDHEGPWWTYFLYMPIYCMPWIFTCLASLSPTGRGTEGEGANVARKVNPCSGITWEARQPPHPRPLSPLGRGGFFVWAAMSIFIFLSLSGSRRSYYILPIVPFVMLWLATKIRPNRWLTWAIAILYVILLINFLILQPYYYLHHPE